MLIPLVHIKLCSIIAVKTAEKKNVINVIKCELNY